MPDHPHHHPTNATIKYVLIVLAILLVALCVFLFIQYQSLRREQLIGGRTSFLSALRRDHGPLGANDIATIRPWMTFDYVNYLFAVPPDYVRTTLNITDPRYPHLTISTFTVQVEDALRSYLGHAATSTSTTSSST